MCCNSEHHHSSERCRGQGHGSFPGSRHHGPMFGKGRYGRRFTTREEKIDQIENYISELRKEIKGAEQHLERLKEEA